jgi:hypothetical protein
MHSDLASKETDREAIKRRLRIWQESGPLLQEQRWRELMALTDDAALRLTKALFSRKIDYLPKRDSSGLIAQQALFRRLLGR